MATKKPFVPFGKKTDKDMPAKGKKGVNPFTKKKK